MGLVVSEKVRVGVHELVDAVLDAKAKGVNISVHLGDGYISACLFEGMEIVDRAELAELAPTKLFNTTVKRVKGWVENA